MNEPKPSISQMEPKDLPTHLSPIFGLMVGVIVLIISGLAFAFGTPILVQIFGLNSTETLEKLASGEPAGGVNFMRAYVVIQQLTIFLIPALVVSVWAYGRKWYSGLGINIPNVPLAWARVVLLWIFSVPLIAFLSWINLKMGVPSGMEQTNEMNSRVIEYLAQMHSPLEYALVFLVLAVLPAIAEELFFRGFIQTQTLRWTGNAFWTILLTAVFFAAFHMEFSAMLPRIFLGVLLGCLFHYNRSLLPSMLFHAINNGMSLGAFAMNGQKLQNMESNEMAKIDNYFWGYLIGAAVSWTLVLLILSRLKDIYDGKLAYEDDED